MSLDQITPATASLDASPTDVLAAAFPRHGRMADPDTGTWMIEDHWMPAEGLPVSSRCDEPDCPAHGQEETVVATVVAAEHLHMEEVPATHPVDLPAYLPTHDQMLADVFRFPLRDVVAAIGATRSAEPGVLLNAMAGDAS